MMMPSQHHTFNPKMGITCWTPIQISALNFLLFSLFFFFFTFLCRYIFKSTHSSTILGQQTCVRCDLELEAWLPCNCQQQKSHCTHHLVLVLHNHMKFEHNNVWKHPEMQLSVSTVSRPSDFKKSQALSKWYKWVKLKGYYHKAKFDDDKHLWCPRRIQQFCHIQTV